MTRRSVPEWIGATPDTKIPARVRLRVFEAHNGRCHISLRKIWPGEAWECDHIQPLCNGGENRETNLAPALKLHHKAKTKIDVATKAKDDRIRKKHLGIYKAKPKPRWRRKVDGTTVRNE